MPKSESAMEKEAKWHAKYKVQEAYVKALEEQIKESQKILIDLRNASCNGCGRKLDLIQILYNDYETYACKECKSLIRTREMRKKQQEEQNKQAESSGQQ